MYYSIVVNLKRGYYYQMSKDQPIDIVPPEERVERDRVERLEQELSALSPGAQVIITRLQPTWCKGQLERITVGDDGIDLDYLIRQWGGQQLELRIQPQGGRIKGRHVIDLFTFDPRRYGEILKDPVRGTGGSKSESPSREIVTVPNPQGDSIAQLGGIFEKMFNAMEARSNSQVELLTTLLAAQMKQTAQAPPASPAQSSVTELLKMARAMGELKELLGVDAGGGQQLSMEEALPGQVLELLKGFTQQRQETGARLTPPVPNPAALQGGAPPPAENVTQIRKPDPLAALKEMDPQQAADSIADILASMPVNKREEVAEHFYKRLSELLGIELEFEDPTATDDDTETQGVVKG